MGSIPILVRANLLYVPIISMPDEHQARLVVQQKFGLSVVNETLASTLSMAKEAISRLQKKQMTVYLWKDLLVFLARQSTTGSFTSRANGQPTRNDAQVDVGMYNTILKYLIDYSGQTSLFIIILLSILKESEKAKFTHLIYYKKLFFTV